MSQENVEIARRAFEADKRREDEAIFDLYDPAIEIEDDPAVPWPTGYCGFKGVKDYFRERVAVFPSQDVEMEEWIDAGD